MSALLAIAALGGGLLPVTTSPLSKEDPCVIADRVTLDKTNERIPFTLDDQVRLVDIGRTDPRGATAIFELSPTRDKVAMVLKTAVPETNTYCLRLALVSMDGSNREIEIDRGGELVRDDYALRDFPAYEAGYDRRNPPRWSPDGSRIAYLKRLNGSTQVWMVPADGKTAAKQISRLPDDVDSLAWTPHGIVVATRPGLRHKEEMIAREAPGGFLFDERFRPNSGSRPFPTGPVETEYRLIPLSGADPRSATPDEVARLVPPRPDNAPKEARLYVPGEGGHGAWLEPKDPQYLLSPSRPVISRPDGRRSTCDAKECEGLRDLWWSRDGTALLGFQWTGWADSQTALWRWDLGETSPRRVLVTDDMLIACKPAGDEVLCARESATQPRRLVAIDARSGRERIIFDPNPRLRKRSFGRVQRLRFRDSNDLEGLADLVLPPDHRPGQKHPLVVVQYRTDGFLRGGTGDEVPIHVLANRGFAVLSFARPFPPPPKVRPRTDEELIRQNRIDWAGRREVQASLEAAVQLAIKSGAVDPERMGISGFSDGLSTVQWALINSSLFKVAATGSCCEDLFSFALSAGPRFGRLIRTPGYRFFEPGSEEAWKPMSLILNVDRLRTPILAQVSDSELAGGLDVVATYQLRGRPFELHVFENEPHVKWQPAHRQAMYQRTVDWFEFWLMRRVDCSSVKEEQYRRWKAMDGAPRVATLSCIAGS